jgi:two-component system, NtrC family, nitrogen regulation sensor histidine kinase NtrY
MSHARRLVLVALLAGALWALTPLLARLVTPPDTTARTFDAVEGTLRRAYDEARTRAARLAAAPLVQAALERPLDASARPDAEGDPAADALLADFARVPYDPHVSVEVWRDRELVAWHGPRITGLQDGLIVRDGEVREALRVVQPVRGPDGRRLGEVRVAVLLRQSVPVRNAYLRPYDPLRTAARRVGGNARLTTPGAAGRLVRAADGTPLARVVVEAGRAARAMRTANVQAFWLVLAGALGVLLAWRPYRHARPAAARLVATFALGVLALVAWRALLLALDVPGRWQTDRAPLAPLFDPERYGTTFLGGAARSLGDLLVTVAGVLVCGGAAATLGATLTRTRRRIAPRPTLDLAAQAAAVAMGTAVLVALGLTLARLAEHSVLDSTLDVFARAGLWPPRYVALLLAALLGATLGLLLVGAAVAAGVRRTLERLGGARGTLPVTLVAFAATLAGLALAVPVALLTIPFVVVAATLGGFYARRLALRRLRARWAVAVVLGLAALLYPLLWTGAEAQQRARMEDEAASFDESRDPRALFALTDALNQARADARLRTLLEAPPDSARRAALDARAADLVRGSLLGSLGAYDVGLTVFAGDSLAGRHAEGATPPSDAFDRDEFDLLRAMQEARAMPDAGPTVEPVTGRREADRFQYLGIVAVGDLGYVTARAEPTRREADTPFPRVLLPAGATAGLPTQLSIALFRDGVLAREVGREYGRYRLDPAVETRLRRTFVLWRTETVQGAPYRTRYERFAPDPARLEGGTRVVAVRAPALTLFDHLFFGLRLMLVGLALAAPVYLFARIVRWRAGTARRTPQHFQERVLDAFLTVGGLGIVLVAVVGVQVVTRENERATEAWLDGRLEALEDALGRAAAPGEPAYAVLERLSADSLARAAGLDLHVYSGDTLMATSRPALVRERLLDTRLPPGIHHALVRGGERFQTAPAYLGTFRYAVGYRTLTDETGRPRYVLAVPTLAEQERLEDEQARVLAYLFGALLLLVLGVAATAAVLARALARPVARLREGLEAVGRGRFDEPIEADSRDEIGALARTFNAMQGQLAESRRQLAQQERQLAWREMARQVAHEIKNPLTPMRLSIQHLRRAYAERDEAADPRFARLFDRITTTLLEQIEALTRIASDFSTFARLPRRLTEPLDVSRVAEEAARLMQEEEGAEVTLALAPGPLVVEADREELRRVFINLVKNALQAMEGREARPVIVRTWREDGAAMASVEDRGTGIPEALRPRIFEPNFSTKTSGTGLGLAIARKAIEESGGSITFETEEGTGTTFTLRLPLADA